MKKKNGIGYHSSLQISKWNDETVEEHVIEPYSIIGSSSIYFRNEIMGWNDRHDD